MLAVLLLGHAVLGGVALATAPLSRRMRAAILGGVALAGIALGLSLAWGGGGAGWRTAAADPASALVAGVAIALAWLLFWALDLGSGRWWAAAAAGFASTSLALAAANRWLVPFLLFWMTTSLAVAVGMGRLPVRAGVWSALFVSDAALVGAFVAEHLATRAWTLPETLEGWPFYAAAAAAAVRAGVVPLVGGWAASGTAAAWALPLMVGGGFVILSGPAGRPDPWAALGAVALATGSAAWIALSRVPRIPAAGAWIVALMAGCTLSAPSAAPAAGVVALLAGGLVGLWPAALGRSRGGRGLALSLTVATAGSAVAVAATARAFERAVAETGALLQGGWFGVAVLLPAGLALGIAVGARVAREQDSGAYEPPAVLASWLLIAATVALGVTVSTFRGTLATALGPRGEVVGLYLFALAAGALAAWIAVRRRTFKTPPEEHFVSLPAGPPRREREVTAAAWGLAAIACGAVAWLTVAGLKLGFL